VEICADPRQKVFIMGNKVSIELTVDDKGSAVVKKFSDTAANKVKSMSDRSVGHLKKLSLQFSKGLGGALSKIGRSLTSLKGIAIGALMGWGITRLIGSFERLSATQEKAEAGMVAAMKSMGRYSEGFETKIKGTASALQGMSTFGDEAILMGTKFLMTYKDIGNDVMPQVMATMTDLAALMKGDFVSAANMLGKASMGMTGELRRVGITVDQATFESEGFIGVLRQIQEQVHGQAGALRATKSGGLEAFGNVVGDVKEKIGYLTTSVKTFIANALLPGVKDINTALNQLKETGKLDEWAKEMGLKVLNVFQTIALGAAGIADTIGGAMRSIWAEINTLWTGFQSLPGWIQGAGLIGAFLYGKKGAVILGGGLHLVTAFKNTYQGLSQVLQGNITLTEMASMNFDQLRNKLQELRDQGIIPAQNALAGTLPTLAETGKYTNQVALFFGKLRDTIGKAVPTILNDLANVKNNAKDTVAALAGVANEALGLYQKLYAQTGMEEYAEKAVEIYSKILDADERHWTQILGNADDANILRLQKEQEFLEGLYGVNDDILQAESELASARVTIAENGAQQRLETERNLASQTQDLLGNSSLGGSGGGSSGYYDWGPTGGSTGMSYPFGDTGVPAHQLGGPIPGVGTGDKVPLMAEPGEYMINRPAVQKYGPDIFEALNKKQIEFLSGGKIVERISSHEINARNTENIITRQLGGPVALRGSAGAMDESYGNASSPVTPTPIPRLRFQSGGIIPSASYSFATPRTESKQIKIEGDIIINVPESAAPQRPEDWRYITREFIIPEIEKAGGHA